jgi:predicted nuclease with TOPRIM domain
LDGAAVVGLVLEVADCGTSGGVMIVSGVIARVRRILPTAHAAATNEAIARATALISMRSQFAVATSHIAPTKIAEAATRTIAGVEYRMVATLA